MRSEDTHDRLMRLLHDHQSRIIERISRGNVSAENVAGGYLHLAGQVVGIDAAIVIIKNCLFGELQLDSRETVADAYDT